MKSAEPKPDFLVIGAQKAGTTWLYENLRTHPDIWMPPVKELHYFDRLIHESPPPLYSRPLQVVDQLVRRCSVKDAPWLWRYYMHRPSDEWYASLFAGTPSEAGAVAGEITPGYATLSPEQIAHVYDVAPNAKIVLMLRNPIERTWSHAVMDFQTERIPDLSARTIMQRFAREDVRLQANYLKILNNWRRFYPEIFAGFMEEVRSDPDMLLSRLYEHLGVDPTKGDRPISGKVHNRSPETMPGDVAFALARCYHEDLVRLEEELGGYASGWLKSAEKIMEERPAEVSCPLSIAS